MDHSYGHGDADRWIHSRATYKVKSIGLCIIHINKEGERDIENDSIIGDSAQNQGGSTLKILIWIILEIASRTHM